MQAYTIGNHLSYDRDLAAQGPLTKLGARLDEDPPYEGGAVWRTAGEARAFIETTNLSFPAAVYTIELPTGWDEDVSPEPQPEDGFHRLLHDATILHRVDP